MDEGQEMLEGHIENGKVVLDEPHALPEGTSLQIEPASSNRTTKKNASQFWGIFLSLAGTVKDMPPDASMKVDEYLYGSDGL